MAAAYRPDWIAGMGDEDDGEDVYGIDRDRAHARAQALAPEEFFWDCADELAPFGSDEGDTALAEFRDWRSENPDVPVLDCLRWTIESVGEMEFADYSDTLLSEAKLRTQLADDEFDDQQYIFTLDVSVIATGFGQLVDEGRIDASAKPTIARALRRQALWASLQPEWAHGAEYRARLKVLERILQAA